MLLLTPLPIILLVTVAEMSDKDDKDDGDEDNNNDDDAVKGAALVSAALVDRMSEFIVWK